MPPRLSLSLLVDDPDRVLAFWHRLGLATGEAPPAMGGPQGLRLVRASAEAAEPGGRTGIVLAVEVDSRDEVDAIVSAAVSAGGLDAGVVEDLGGRYVRAFADPEGTVWLAVWDAGAGLHDPREARIHATTTETEQDA